MGRVVIVSNRLPVTVRPDRQPPDDAEQSSGGLVSALRSVAGDYDEALWIGWPGGFYSNDAEKKRLTDSLSRFSDGITLVPVWLSHEDVEDFYNGFSNASLWPLLHWMTPYARFKKSWSEAYKRVNQKFADAILSVARPDDRVWVHDYHLFLVPRMLREAARGLPGTPGSLIGGGVHHLAVSGAPPPRPKDLPPPLRFPDAMPAGSVEGSGQRSPESGAVGAGPWTGIPASEEDARQIDQVATPQGKLLTPSKRVCFASVKSKGSAGNTASSGRESLASLRIAFFLHTPFPSFEVISALPICNDIVEGVLGADLVGFHTYNYLRHFRSCVIRTCGFTPEMDVVEHMGRRSKLGVFPIGANCSDIRQAMRSEVFAEHLREYTAQFQGKSLVLSVERLDYTKGMPQKLAAIERYLEEAECVNRARKRDEAAPVPSPQEEERAEVLEGLQKKFEERAFGHRKGMRTSMGSFLAALPTDRLYQWAVQQPRPEEVLDHSKTVFLFIAVPSRQGVQEYQNIEEEVHRTISTINGRFSTVNHTPIVYIHRGVTMDELAALYAVADCCLVTPLIDGMNLVAKEFVAAKDKEVENVVPGTIVLSEFAGAAQELFDALVVNPYDVDTVADAIHTSLELTKGSLATDERWAITDRMRNSILKNDAQAWAKRLLSELERIPIDAMPLASVVYPLIDFTAACFFRKAAGTKAIFLDLDDLGFEELRMDRFEPLTDRLSTREDLRVFVVSGRGTAFLEGLFGSASKFAIIAEHGLLFRPAHRCHWEQVGRVDPSDWMEKVRPLMELFERCTPNARLEVRTSSISWDYSGCDEEYGLFKTKELVHQLALSLCNLPCRVCQGDKVVEVVSSHVRKGWAVQEACREQGRAGNDFSSILCLGGGSASEPMFEDAPAMAYTVRVGDGQTRARHRIRDWAEADHFLRIVADDRLPGGGSADSAHSCVFKSIDERRPSLGHSDADEDPFGNLQDAEEPT